MEKQILVVSGVSGAGKSTMANALEDLGFSVIDNLPANLLGRSISLLDEFNKNSEKIAFVVDAREANSLKQFPKMWQKLQKQQYQLHLLFLDCSVDTIIKRYKETRRRHPLERGKGIRDAIKQESVLLAEIKDLADNIISTDDLNSHELKEITKQRFPTDGSNKTLVTFLSFGFKYGVPSELDLCFDVRFLKNPYFDSALRPLTGLDKKVSRYVLQSQHATQFLKHLTEILQFLVPLYQQEGKSYVTVAIGCTGGQHRSVALAEELKDNIKLSNCTLRTEHRDTEKNQVQTK